LRDRMMLARDAMQFLADFYLLLLELESYNEYYTTNKETVRSDTIKVSMALGRGGNRFHLARPHTLLLYTYLLPYPYPAGMRN